MNRTIQHPFDSTSISTSAPETTDSTSSGPRSGYAAYYSHMRVALASAKAEVGDDLTRWRDAVGKAEMNKEKDSGAAKTSLDDEDGEEEEASEED